ncbi:MAG: hypothetical protein KKF89_03035, partial [Nanoarchaeota archaeon]|nr:hypothetical protein [Nanoarchaeota archaeon]
KLEDATKSIPVKILIVVFDREEVYFAKLKGQGYEILGKIQGDVQKKEEKHISKNDFYKQITEKIQEYNKIDNLNNIILASPSFWKENLIKILPEELKKKTVLATISQVSERSFSEVLKRDELKKILEKNQGTQEVKLLDKLLQHISKNTACYGLKDTKEKIEIGAVSELMISDSYLQNTKEKGFYKEVEKLMIACEQMDGKTHIISSEEAKKSLDSLSGIAGILRWNN